MHGQFVWYELLTPDPDGSKTFYQPLAGWSTQPFDKDYSMWTLGGVPVGGMFRQGPEQQGTPPNWTPYVESGNVDETARQATALGGGVVHGPEDIPTHGRYAILRDPQGAVFGVYKPSGKSDAWDGAPVLSRFSWHELMTTDYKAAVEFYRELFSWEKTSEADMGPLGMYYMYGMKGKPYGGMFNRPPEMSQVPPFWLPYVLVKDLKKATDVATQNGAEIVNGPMEVPGGDWIVVLKDPQGAAIALHQLAAKSAAKPAAKPKSKPKKKAKAKTKAKPKAKAKSKPKKKARAKAKPRAKAKKKKSRR